MKRPNPLDYFHKRTTAPRYLTAGDIVAMVTISVATLIAVFLMVRSIGWGGAENYAWLLLVLSALPIMGIEAWCCTYIFRNDRAAAGDLAGRVPELSKTIILAQVVVSGAALVVGFVLHAR